MMKVYRAGKMSSTSVRERGIVNLFSDLATHALLGALISERGVSDEQQGRAREVLV